MSLIGEPARKQIVYEFPSRDAAADFMDEALVSGRHDYRVVTVHTSELDAAEVDRVARRYGGRRA